LQHISKIILFAFLVSFSIQATAQTDQRTQTTKIADLLAMMPAQTTKQLSNGMEQVAALGNNGLIEMIDMLSTPGKADNSALQFAIGSYSAYVTKTGREQQRAAAVQSYCNAIDKLADKWNKEFIIRQLQIAGKDDAVPCLQKYLKQELLSEAATRALAQIHTAASDKALMNALKDADGPIRVAIVEALGYDRYKPAQAAMVSMAGNSDPKLQKVALYSLARIADPASMTVLANAAKKANYTFNYTDALAAYIYYLQQLAATRAAPLAEKAAKELMSDSKAAGQLHTRTAALKLLVDLKKEKSLPLLYEAMKDTSSKYRAAALGFSEKYLTPAVNKQWLQTMATVPAATEAQIITMLSKTGDKTLLPAFAKSLQSKTTAVKVSAIAATGEIGQQASLPALLNVLKTASPAEIEAVSTAILTMKGDKIPETIATAINTMPSSGKVALIKVLAARSADQTTEKVLAQLSSTDIAVHRAAVNALPSLAQEKDLPKLFSLLNAASSADDISALQKAVVAASSSVRDTAQRSKMIISQMQSASNGKGYLLLEVLGAVGGKDALKEIQSSFDKGDGNTKKAAIAALSKSNSLAAARVLLAIAQKSSDSEYQPAAVNGYIQLISKSSFPGDQKLLMLREAMALAKTVVQRNNILKEVGRCNSFLAMLFAGQYLDDATVQQEAAHAVMVIGLANKDFTGDIVRKLLTKTAAILQGQDSEYQKTALKKQLAEMPADAGFVSLFNEKDLTGWKGLVADPVKRAKMSPDTLAAAQVRADKQMNGGWQAKDGLLIFTSHGSNLCTVKQYSDFEMFVDWKITPEGDAGIYLRGSPQVQIWDTSRVSVGAQVGSGGLYNNQKNQSKPLKVADNPVNEWNNFHIIMKGDKVTVYLNGQLVTDNITLENYWDRARPIFAKEQIELQAHGTLVAYRNLYLKELSSSTPFVLSDEEKKEGFKTLFDGANLDQWTGNKTDYSVDNGNIFVNPVGGGHGNLYTLEQFSDFSFRFEFQLTEGANNGIGIRAPLEGDAAYVGMEIQVLDNDAEIYKNLHVYQYHGSVYGIIPAKRGFLKPLGEWNYEEITAKGNKIKVILNNEVILDGDIAEATKNGTPDGQKHPGLFNKTGHIGFLGHGSVLRFRNIRVKDLTK
jgi:HEAT repeat protein